MALNLSHCTIDLERRHLRGPTGDASLSPLEAGLLRYLAVRPGRLVSREELLVEVWGYAPGVQSRAVDKAVTRLRRKIEADPANPVSLISSYGGGYGLVLASPVAEPMSTSFIGRRQEMAQAVGHLSEHRQLTLVGPPGAGKTSLSRQLRLADTEEWLFCNLRRARTRAEVHAAVSAALGIALTTADDAERLHLSLAARTGVLLVLDNAEQLDASGDIAVAELAASATPTLVTSRRPVGFSGEVVQRLPPLDSSEARELFYLRAREARPDVALRAKEVEELTRALDGLPLAIELAAARVRVLEVEQVMALLEQRFSLLRGRDLDLLSSLQWSWELLEPWEQASLAQLSVLEGAFDLVTAEAIVDLARWSEAPWMVDIIARLAEHSLIQVRQVGSRTEYDVLESIRSFAASQLEETEGVSVRARHGVWFEQLGKQLVRKRFGPRGLETRQRLRSAREDLLAVLGRARPERAVVVASALDALLLTTGPADQRFQMWASIDLEGLPGPTRAHVLRRRGDAALRCGRPQRALADLETALKVATPEQRPATLGNLGAARMMVGQLEQAEPMLREALAALQTEVDPWAEFTTVANLATLSWLRGSLDQAEAGYSEALAIAREARDAPGQALCLGWLGGLHVQRGAHERALSVLEQAELACRSVHNRVGELVAIGNQGVVRLELADFAAATSAFEAAIERARTFGERRLEGLFLGNLGLVHFRRGEHERAVERFSEAIAIQARKGGDQRMEAYLTAWRAAARLPFTGVEAARASLQQAQGTLDALGDSAGLALVGLCGAMVDPDTHEEALGRACRPSASGLAPSRCSSDVRVALQLLAEAPGEGP